MAVKLARQLMQKDEDDVENNEEERCAEGDACVEEEEVEQEDDIEGYWIVQTLNKHPFKNKWIMFITGMDTIDSISEFQLNASKPH